MRKVAMSLKKNKPVSYEEYLNKLTKKELTSILDAVEMEYNSKAKTEELVTMILDELDDIISKTLNYFTLIEYRNLKMVLKRKGHVKLRTNVGLMQFCQMLTVRHLMYKIDDKTFILFKEVYKEFKNKSYQKKVIKKCQKNNNELHLVLGTLLIYGAISLKDFYLIYCEKYEISENDLKDYLLGLKKYSNAFNIYEEKDDFYLANKKIKNIKECKKYADKKNRKAYSFEEIERLYTLRYMKKYKSYRKLKKFITSSYYIEKNNFHIVVDKIIIPFIEEYQLDKDHANEVLDSLVDDYFEFNSNKYKNKLITLADNFVKDYPNWNLKGYSEREKEK